MSNFVVGVGGTGAKLVQTLIHLSAAGLLPDPTGGGLSVLLVDPDEKNGTGAVTTSVAASYTECKKLHCGTTDLFKSHVEVRGPWTPVSDQDVATLATFFGYSLERERNPVEADMMDVLFTPEQRDMKIREGFRGLPAIGSAILSKTINFSSGEWNVLRRDVRAAAVKAPVPILLAGSVFGGSGAAGVPTICRLLQGELMRANSNLRLGLILFLPYFQYKPVDGQSAQADPHAFAAATVESLKYYDEGQYLSLCKSIYTLGEEHPSMEPRSAVGGKEQVNDPHFLELIAGLGALRFMSGEDKDGTVSLAARADRNELRWSDLPLPESTKRQQLARLRTMILFAIAFRFYFFPQFKQELSKGEAKHPVLKLHLKGDRALSLAELGSVDRYVEEFLTWLLRLSTPAGLPNFRGGLVNLSTFAVMENGTWRLKAATILDRRSEFREDDLAKIFPSAEGFRVPNGREISKSVAEQPVNDSGATGTGVVVRAIYDACKIS